MPRHTFELGESPKITVAECRGDLRVHGTEVHEVEVRVYEESSSVVPDGAGGVAVTAASDCRVSCPSESTLIVKAVHGDVRVTGLSGSVTVESASGDVQIRGAGTLEFGSIAGDLNCRGLAGELRVSMAAGDVHLRGVGGGVSLASVGGDLTADHLGGSLLAESVGADVRLGPPFVPGATYRVRAGGGLRLNVEAGSSLQMHIRSGGPVRSKVPGLDVSPAGDGVLGQGEATLEADVGGTARIRLVDSVPTYEAVDLPDLSGLGEMIEAEIAGAMAGVEAELAESLAAIDSDEIRRIYEQQADKMLKRSEEVARREGQRADRMAEQAQLRAERAERRWRRASGRPVQPKAEPISDDERLQVLRMVEEGKVSPQEAADLLAALQGR